ncbi:HEAT repeat domain-containing protein [Ramlibacter sp. WS9]|uniref:HEAT repeat domain-containing protein n=1 Tax=Ramlibacter sp. WS9 TaxID=1882741 RepID=UPI001144531A|nr:HEAT repeat domain-containing protein [Ramlibacter sp. WS9]
MLIDPTPWLEALDGSDDAQRKEATLRLGGLSPLDDVDVLPISQGLRSSNEKVAFWSAIALGCLGDRARPVVSSLLNTAREHHAFGVRQACIAALGKLASLDLEARACVFTALSDSSPFVRREALQVISGLRTLEAEEIYQIRKLAADSDEAVARWSEIALRETRDGK